MNDMFRYALVAVMCVVIFCCGVRQRRYWRELTENRPSTSLRVGYRLAILSTVVTLAVCSYVNTDAAWQIFGGVLLTMMFFLMKITFSPTVIALTLTLCTFRLMTQQDFPLIEVWTGITSALMWRLPEDVRAVYACISFAWVLVAFLSSGSVNAAAEDSSVAETLTDSIGSL